MPRCQSPAWSQYLVDARTFEDLCITTDHSCDTTSDDEHGNVDSSSAKSTAQNENSTADQHGHLPAELVGTPDLVDTPQDRTSRVYCVQGSDHVACMAIPGFTGASKIEVGIEVGLADGRADDGKTVGRGDGSDSDEEDEPEVVGVDLAESQHLDGIDNETREKKSVRRDPIRSGRRTV